MSFFIFQHSRRQLADYLQSAVEEVSQAQTEDSKRTDQEAEAKARKLDYLRKAVEAAEKHTVESEYWSDLRVLTEGKDRSLLNDRDVASAKGKAKATQYDGTAAEGFAGDIQGIPEEAGVGVDEGLDHLHSGQ